VQISDCPYFTALVFTQDPLVVSQLSQSYQRIGKQPLQQMRSELSQQWIAIMQLIDQQMGRMGRGSAEMGGAINDAVTAYRVASDLIVKSSGDAATTFLDRTEERLGFSRRETAVGPLGLFQSKTSSPFVAHASLIPLHWRLTDRLKTSGTWDPNGLPAGDFESLEHMQRAGWENHRTDAETISTRVELSNEQVVLGRKSLKLAVVPSGSAGIVEERPLWIVSPSIKVEANQMVQIHGWVNVPQIIQGNMDGLMITDSAGGQSLAERIVATNGWEEFTLYRSIDSAGELNVRFDLSGYGVAYLDEVTIRTIDLR
jgi:chaperonin cofactor prefoldin